MHYFPSVAILLPLLAVIVSPVPCTAQTPTVSPVQNTLREGNTWSVDPFGTGATPYRWLQVHDDLTGPRTIRSLSFRPDGWGNVPANGFTYTLQLSEAPASVNARSIAPAFDGSLGNHGANFVQHANQTGSFKALPYVEGEPTPRQATMTLLLPTPYALSAGARLVWDIKIETRQGWSGPTVLDAVSGPDSGAAVGRSFGSGCPRNPQVGPLGHTLGLGVNWAAGTMSVGLTATDATPGGIVVFCIAVRPFLPTPIDLNTRGPSGPCFLHVDPMFIGLVSTADPNGYAFVDVGQHPLPAPTFNLYSQAFAYAPGANQFDWITSNGHQFYVGTPTLAQPSVGVLYQNQLNAPTAAPSSGLVVTFQ